MAVPYCWRLLIGHSEKTWPKESDVQVLSIIFLYPFLYNHPFSIMRLGESGNVFPRTIEAQFLFYLLNTIRPCFEQNPWFPIYGVEPGGCACSISEPLLLRWPLLGVCGGGSSRAGVTWSELQYAKSTWREQFSSRGLGKCGFGSLLKYFGRFILLLKFPCCCCSFAHKSSWFSGSQAASKHRNAFLCNMSCTACTLKWEFPRFLWQWWACAIPLLRTRTTGSRLISSCNDNNYWNGHARHRFFNKDTLTYVIGRLVAHLVLSDHCQLSCQGSPITPTACRYSISPNQMLELDADTCPVWSSVLHIHFLKLCSS